MTSEIIGHQKILDYFAKVMDNGNLSHAYCFVGPANVGKRTLAKELSAQLLKTTVAKLPLQPDFVELDRIKDEKTGKTKKDISIEQLRDKIGFFASHAFLGGYKIMIINSAEKMSLGAANALLKSLEEPRRQTLIFLLTKNEKQLPQTILSRCQSIYFSPVLTDEIRLYLISQGFDNDKAEEMARLAHGLPGQAKRWAADADKYLAYQAEVLRFNSLIGRPFYDKIQQVEELFGEKKDADHIARRSVLAEILGVWRMVVRDLMIKNNERADFCLHHLDQVVAIAPADLIEIDKRIKQAGRDLERNIHPRLLIENILLSIP